MINKTNYFVNTVNEPNDQQPVDYHKVVEHVINVNNDSQSTEIQTDVVFSSIGAELKDIFENNKDTLQSIITNIEGKTEATTYFNNNDDCVRVDTQYQRETTNNG